jgi:thioredoxin-disulfide reductase
MKYDSIIIGLSAAGISAAIYLKRRNINFLIIGKDWGGEMALSGIIENYPGIIKTDGVELTNKFKNHLLSYDISYSIEEVKNIKKIKEDFEVITNKNTYITKSIIIASGSKPKKLNIPGESEFYHKGVSYCYVCDLPLFKNKKVAIIGGGNTALESSLMASGICEYVYLINKNAFFKGDQILISQIEKKQNVKIIYKALTKEIYGDKFVKGLRYLDIEKNELINLEIDGVFIHIGMKPNSEFVPEEWQIKNSYQEIVVNKICETSIEGIFAAGDVTDITYKQIGIAVGQGIIAALSTINYLNLNVKNSI